ncbi:MAG: hypothetical protein U5K81_03905 [Trueperaceae bacterium]|nr:hypothetical protein [Trueperaceae bacterium]
MALRLVPLVGPFHLRFPRYNAVTVRDVVAAEAPELVLTTALPAGAFREPDWKTTEEVALPMAVVPWAHARGVPLRGAAAPSPDPAARADLERYLSEATAARPAMERLADAEAPMRALLEAALDQERIVRELLPAVQAVHDTRLELFGDGPGTDWLENRADRMAADLRRAARGRTVVLAPIEHLPPLLGRLGDDAAFATVAPPSDEARRRALLDSALSGEAREPARLLEALRELAGAEARLAEADVLLAHGHPAEALEVLEQASRGDFSRPYHVPGWLLARLGQLYDLAGRRDDARRAYRGALALDWAPEAAREAARLGLERPFGEAPGS